MEAGPAVEAGRAEEPEQARAVEVGALLSLMVEEQADRTEEEL